MRVTSSEIPVLTDQSVEPNKIIRFKRDGRIMRGDEVVGFIYPINGDLKPRRKWWFARVEDQYGFLPIFKRNKRKAKSAAREALSLCG